MEEFDLKGSEITSFKKKQTNKHVVNLEIVRIPYVRDSDVISLLERIDDEFYIDEYLDVKNDLWFGGGTILFCILLYIFFEEINNIIFVLIPFFIWGVLLIMKNLLIKNKKVILDRKNGLFAYPNFFSNKLIVTKFDEAVLLIVYIGKMAVPVLKAPQTNIFTNFTIATIDVLDRLSFYVWYMDKNRPLPPGTAFDAYRDKDFKRRKTEGFPPPLYRSAVPTPEATPEQQEEREGYWRDEDYMCPEFKREKESVLFDVNVHTDWLPFQYSEVPLQEGSYNTWHRYEFTDGNITYMRTDAYGKGYRPPQHIECKESIVTIKKSWWE